MRVAVMGATGYGGQVLMRLLMDHPNVDSILPVSSSVAGSSVYSRDPGLGADPGKKLANEEKFLTRDEAVAAGPDAVFSALPPKESANFCEPFFGESVVFDLSADFRLKNPADHEKAYGVAPPFPGLREKSVYGLSEVYRDQIKSADIVAVPGCYPTCVLLPLIPVASTGLIEGPITVNAVSGISGAGRKAKEISLFVERSESVVAYNPGLLHRHVPEMKQNLRLNGCDAPFFFTPHLVPMRRGMEATTTSFLQGRSIEVETRITEVLEEAYGDSEFVKLRYDELPDTSDVVGSNRCDIGWRVVENPDGSGVMLYLFSVIDNLVKGAAGQAVQDFNIRFGFDESAGLPLRGRV